jgi:hypothetical protein
MSSLGRPPDGVGQEAVEIALVLVKLRNQQSELERKVLAT